MPIAQGLAGLFTSPIFILLITAFILKERIGPVRILAVGLGFFGIILVLELEASSLSWVSFIPVFGGFFMRWGLLRRGNFARAKVQSRCCQFY